MDAISVKGHLDGLQGAYIVGWAMGRRGQHCEIVVADEDDNVLAEGRASIERPDLASVGDGRCDFAFRIPIPALGGAKRIHVLADGVELRNSPQLVGRGMFDGRVVFARGRVQGWVTERVSNFEPPLISVVDQDGRIVMQCQAAIERSADDGKFAPARFKGELAQWCFGAGELHLTALANGTKFAQGSTTLPLQGFVEIVSHQRCSGWLLAPGASDRCFSFDIWRDGEKIAKALCDIPRKDVQASYPGSHHVGFDIVLPRGRAEPLSFTALSFRFPGSDRELFEGPYVVGPSPALVTAARQVSRVAVGPMSYLLGAAERAVLQAAMGDFIARARQTDRLVLGKQALPETCPVRTRLTVVIPIYRGVDITQACIESVLACRSDDEDRLVLVDDHSPEPEMAVMLKRFAATPGVFILTNPENLGFVKSINRGLSFTSEGDILLLNADTVMFPGAISELLQVAHAAPDIGTVTAMSSNATIFSYPHVSLRTERLPDISWEELAEVALRRHAGRSIDVPTGHGFCLLVKRTILDRIGPFDEAFGRGYGEENDFCARAADLGYRNVAATGVLVEHRESVSFAGDKQALLSTNHRILEGRYPEYTPIIMEVERRDDLRSARWPLDADRLTRASAAGAGFVLVVSNGLGGGTSKAIADIEASVGYAGRARLSLGCRQDGFIELASQAPPILAIFAQDEATDLFELLGAATIDLVVVHQVLGFTPGFVAALGAWVRTRRGIFHAHDFYPLCPRVTMIDAVDQFCNLAAPDVCNRCVALAGPHASSRFEMLSPAAHRAVFADFLSSFRHVLTPSRSTAEYFRRGFAHIVTEALPHPAPDIAFPHHPRAGNDDEIVLLGAIGPHKGAARLLELAQLARLTHPNLRFRVIGFTNRDEELLRVGNVTITGTYAAADLPRLAAQARGRLALFLSGWPETFSYTLSEAVGLGFIPLVPDIGAFAERVKNSGYGAIFAFPIVPAQVLGVIADIGAGRLDPAQGGPRGFYAGPEPLARTRAIYTPEVISEPG